MTSKKAATVRPGFSPLSILRTIWKRKLSIGLTWLLVGGIGAGVVYKLPAVYSSEAVILVDSQKIPEKYVSSTVSTDLQDRIATISQQILSSMRLKKIIEDFDLYRDERKSHFEEEILEIMHRDIKITLERGWTGNRPGAFRVSYEGATPAVVAQVANRLANYYIEENLKTREVQAAGTSEFMQNQLQEAKKRLDELEAAVSEYKLKHNGELPQQENALSGTLSRLQVELEANRDALNRAQERKLALENTLNLAEATTAAMIKDAAASTTEWTEDTESGAAPQDQSKRRRGSEVLQVQLDLMRVRYSDDHPDVKRMKADLDRLKSLEQKQEADKAAAGGLSQTGLPDPAAVSSALPPKSSARATAAGQPKLRADASPAPDLVKMRERMQAVKSEIMLVDRELEFRKSQQEGILRKIADYQGRVAQLPIREQEMARIMRDYDIAKSNYKSLLEKFVSAEMATDMERRQKSERFTILDPARVPEKPSKPNRPAFYMLGAVLGLVIGLGVGLGREIKQGVVLGEWELPSGVTILGRLPHIAISPESAAASKMSGLRGKLLKRKLRLALVSSALFSLFAGLAVGIYLVLYRP